MRWIVLVLLVACGDNRRGAIDAKTELSEAAIDALAFCGDGVQNGTETDIDCGGDDPDCSRCLPGLKCKALGDCTNSSDECKVNVCGGAGVCMPYEIHHC